MALLFCDGFDQYALFNATTSPMFLREGWIVTNNNGYVVQNAGRNGGQCFYVNNTFLGPWWNPGRPITTGIIGVAYKQNAAQTLNAQVCGFYAADNNFHAGVRVTSAGKFEINTNNEGTTVAGPSTLGLTYGAWTYIEFKCTPSATVGANTCVLRVNGTVVLTVTAGTSVIRSGQAATIWGAALGCKPANSQSSQQWYDDFYFCDATGSTNNDFLGDCRIETLTPSVGTSSQFTVTGAATNAAAVLTPEETETTCVTASTNNLLDTYNMSNLTATVGTVYGVVNGIHARKTNTAATDISSALRIGSTNYVSGTAKRLGTTMDYVETIYETNPATGNAFTIAEVNSMEAGFKRTS